MGIKTYRPTTPARRYYMVDTFDDITRDKPHESLLRPLPKSGGRNNTGRKTNKWIGGGEKQQYRARGVKDDVDSVVPPGVQSEDFHVQHVG